VVHALVRSASPAGPQRERTWETENASGQPDLLERLRPGPLPPPACPHRGHEAKAPLLHRPRKSPVPGRGYLPIVFPNSGAVAGEVDHAL